MFSMGPATSIKLIETSSQKVFTTAHKQFYSIHEIPNNQTSPKCLLGPLSCESVRPVTHEYVHTL